jgi:hypothetical protein
MMKQFILAATSISYILSIANIADAKIKTSIQKVDREQTCQNQESNPTQAIDISTSDIRAICQLITNHYKEVSKNYLKHQLFVENYPEKIRSGYRINGVVAIEVTNLNVVSYTNNIGKSTDRTAKIQVVFNTVVYDWSSKNRRWNPDESVKYDGVKIEVEFHKKNGKWSRDTKNATWNNDIQQSIEASSRDDI